MKQMIQLTMIVLFGLVTCLEASHDKDTGMYIKPFTAYEHKTEFISIKMQFKKITSYIDLFLDLHATVFLSTGGLVFSGY